MYHRHHCHLYIVTLLNIEFRTINFQQSIHLVHTSGFLVSNSQWLPNLCVINFESKSSPVYYIYIDKNATWQ